MKSEHPIPACNDRRSCGAFSLVELIGVLAIVAVVAGLLVPAALRHLDRLAAEQELKRLRTLGDAFQAGILRRQNIPAHTNWAAVIAAEGGTDLAYVTQNVRRRARILLIDPSGWLSTNLPYSQTDSGSPVFPASARMMLVSSMGMGLPLTNGMPAAAEFTGLWDAPAGTLPATTAWNGWGGEPGDVLVHRLNLSPLFIRLLLTTYASSTNGQYTIGTNGSSLNLVGVNSGFAAYFLKGTSLRLHNGPPGGTQDSIQVLNDDRSFVYESGLWRDSVVGRVVYGAGDVAGIVAAFLAANPNTNAYYRPGNTQQVLVVRTMVEYLSNYTVWADANFPNGALKTYLQGPLKDGMLNAVRGLFSSAGSWNQYPTNGEPCL